MWRDLWIEMTTGSRKDETLHAWGTIAFSHVVLGATATWLMLWLHGVWSSDEPPMLVILGVPFWAYVVKECLFDLSDPEASILDSVVDTLLFALGVFCYALMPLAPYITGIVAIGILLRGATAPLNR